MRLTITVVFIVVGLVAAVACGGTAEVEQPSSSTPATQDATSEPVTMNSPVSTATPIPPTETPVPTNTPIPANTPVPTDTPEPTYTSTVTPTRTPRPTEVPPVCLPAQMEKIEAGKSPVSPCSTPTSEQAAQRAKPTATIPACTVPQMIGMRKSLTPVPICYTPTPTNEQVMECEEYAEYIERAVSRQTLTIYNGPPFKFLNFRPHSTARGKCVGKIRIAITGELRNIEFDRHRLTLSY